MLIASKWPWGFLTASGDDVSKGVIEQVRDQLINPMLWVSMLFVILKIIVIIIISAIVIKIANKALEHMMKERERNPLKLDRRRAKTIGKLTKNVISYTVNFISIMLILNQIGLDLAPLLAGAGVLGLAIGFGAQSLVKDVITGFFIIFEDQFAIGDVIETGKFKGTVEEIGLRVTKIKSWTGEVHIIPNGSIQQVTNFSIYNSLAVVDVPIAYEEDIERAIRILNGLVKKLFEEHENIVTVPEVLGVQTLGNTEVNLRITAECRPNTQGIVSRAMKAEISKELRAHQMELPYPKVINYSRVEKAE